MNLQTKIKKLPDTPGIYLFYNSKSELVYVGKATSLRDRVGSYFRPTPHTLRSAGRTLRPVEQMIHEVKNIKVIKTDSVLEAILLEGEYIKKYRPKYNIDWKDDKSWNYIYITDDKYPKVLNIREHELEKSKVVKSIKSVKSKDLFGPYPGFKTKETMRLLQKMFYISMCRPGSKRPCLYNEMGTCLGVCTGEISATDYKIKVIRPLTMFLRGNKKRVIKNLEKKMKEASKEKDFEEAGRLLIQIKSLQKIQDIALLNKSFVKDEIKLEKTEFNKIEGYDISNLGETDKVGGMVVFDGGQPAKNLYRKFNIKSVVGQSDIDCLEEVITRRIKHAEWPLPDLFLIDGGKPQVNRVSRVLSSHPLLISPSGRGREVFVVGIAKGAKRNKNEFILKSRDKKLVSFIKQNKNLLIQVRDEAHRFAIAFNRSKRKIKRV